MIFDGSTVSDGETFEADICVVGAGAAGLTLALDLSRRGLKVVVVESGGLIFEQRTNDLLDIELGGRSTDRLVQGTRERFFGGTTNHWGGVCRAFDAFEFEPHSWVPYSGWPISRADLDPYYVLAAQLLGLPEVQRDFGADTPGFGDRPRLSSKDETAVEAVLWRRVPDEHLRMGQWRRGEVEASQLVHCVLNTTIAEIHTDASKERVASLEGRTFDNKTLHFKARNYVLCTGAVENARLLLASNSVVPQGLGNTHDLVGRFFMDHPANILGRLLLADPSGERSQEEFLLDSEELVGWATTPEAREEFHLQGCMMWLWPKGTPKRPLPYEVAISDLTRSPSDPAADTSQSRYLEMVVNWEQAPNPSSRVTLSSQRDVFGIRKPHLHWDVTKQDVSSALKSAELMSLALARSGQGRLRLEEITGSTLTLGGGHQMGTTRMSNDPKLGVTDANGRVHSVENLFIGGSSLFPTGGWQHPTFTIIAMALRQAEFLASGSH
jgi:choline dehydrogenase-like flavoprotein